MSASVKAVLSKHSFLVLPHLQAELLKWDLHSALVEHVYDWKQYLADCAENDLPWLLQGVQKPQAFRAAIMPSQEQATLFSRGYSAGMPLADYATSEDQGWQRVDPAAPPLKEPLPLLQLLPPQELYTVKSFQALTSSRFWRRDTQVDAKRGEEATEWLRQQVGPRPPQPPPVPFALPLGVAPAEQRHPPVCPKPVSSAVLELLPNPHYVQQTTPPPMRRIIRARKKAKTSASSRKVPPIEAAAMTTMEEESEEAVPYNSRDSEPEGEGEGDGEEEEEEEEVDAEEEEEGEESASDMESGPNY